jgi:hypothetical protein
MIRASAPVVAAVAPTRAGTLAPPALPTLSPRSAAPPRPVASPPSPPAPAPADEFLPVSAPAGANGGTAAPAPRDVEDLLPLLPADPTAVQKVASRRLPPIDKKLALMGAGAVLLIAAIAFIWVRTRDDVKTAVNSPVEAVRNAERIAAQSRLQTAAAAAQVQYMDTGSYSAVTPASLRAAEPSIDWVPGDQGAQPDQISVQVVDAQSIVMVTSLPDKSCQAVYQSPTGTTSVQLAPPCQASAYNPNSPGLGNDDQLP